MASESVTVATAAVNESAVVDQALAILGRRLREPGVCISSPSTAIDYLRLQIADREREVFVVVFLDNKHRVITCEEMFLGTIDGASVHPREVVKACLRHNAAAVLFAHNHPSGDPTPSFSDRAITKRLEDTLSCIDVRVVDHFVLGGADCESVKWREKVDHPDTHGELTVHEGSKRAAQVGCKPLVELGEEELACIRKALLIGLTCYGEIEEKINRCELLEEVGNPLPGQLMPLHPTGTADVVSTFATALSYVSP